MVNRWENVTYAFATNFWLAERLKPKPSEFVVVDHDHLDLFADAEMVGRGPAGS